MVVRVIPAHVCLNDPTNYFGNVGFRNSPLIALKGMVFAALDSKTAIVENGNPLGNTYELTCCSD